MPVCQPLVCHHRRGRGPSRRRPQCSVAPRRRSSERRSIQVSSRTTRISTNQPAPSRKSSTALIVGAPARERQTGWPAAASRARARAAADSLATSSSPPPAVARSSAARARSTSISLESSAISVRIVTTSLLTDRKPPCAAASIPSPASPPVMRTVKPSASTPSSEMWTGKIPSSPSSVRATTKLASPDHTLRSAETSSTVNGTTVLRSSLAGEPLGVGLDIGDATGHEERLFGQVVEVAVAQLAERLDRLRQWNERTLLPGERLGDEHVLRQEPLDATRPTDENLVLFTELVDAEDRDDVLQVLVALEDLLDAVRDVEVLLADVLRVENARRRVERVDSGVDALLRNRPREHGGRVEVGERRVRGRVGDVVGGHVDRLQRGDRVTAGRRDALLQHAHLVGQRRLVTDRGRHAAEKRRHLRAGLREPEDVVDEEQHVLVLHVAEVLRHRQCRESDPKTGARRLVHLTEHERGVLDDARLGHFKEEIVALTGALADTGEHRHT